MNFNRTVLVIFFEFICILAVTQSFFIPKVKDKIKSLIFKTKCLEDLGCFSNGPPFYHPLLRPLSLLPFDLKDINTKFWLYTPTTGTTNRYLLEKNANSLAKSPYDKRLTVKFLIHGYATNMVGGDYTLNKQFLEALINTKRHNVILVDWTDSNLKPYMQAIANGRVVGAQIAKMVEFLQKSAGVKPKDVHIIGHSLGSHIAGWAGERIPKLGRITGLDPAGPYFRKSDPKVRLDETDADFVDVIHTNGALTALTGLGIPEPIGHIDFYPNGGSHQPGCKSESVTITTGPNNDIVEFGGSKGCNHFRVLEFFTESITNTKCQFTAVQCASETKFDKNQCKSGKKAVMGYNSKKVAGVPVGTKFFLKTSDKLPFCMKG